MTKPASGWCFSAETQYFYTFFSFYMLWNPLRNPACLPARQVVEAKECYGTTSRGPMWEMIQGASQWKPYQKPLTCGIYIYNVFYMFYIILYYILYYILFYIILYYIFNIIYYIILYIYTPVKNVARENRFLIWMHPRVWSLWVVTLYVDV